MTTWHFSPFVPSPALCAGQVLVLSHSHLAETEAVYVYFVAQWVSSPLTPCTPSLYGERYGPYCPVARYSTEGTTRICCNTPPPHAHTCQLCLLIPGSFWRCWFFFSDVRLEQTICIGVWISISLCRTLLIKLNFVFVWKGMCVCMCICIWRMCIW